MAEELATTNTTEIVPLEQIQGRIHTIRGQNVMLDSDLAELYGVETKTLNRAVQRNIARFPDDFMFQLTAEESDSLRYQFGTSNAGRGGRRYLPYAFTEQGVAMLSSVLRSERAALTSNDALAHKILEMEQKYDKRFEIVFEAIRQLIAAPPAPERRMGFRPGPKETL